ncbi:hypothetical protein BDA96_01G321800 [Sorghum bicolor]|uniref:Uncharacterized protein n=2 Tax=Sorghum bicolor TaxID=4558 RepID=A0A1Z5S8S8_SORBI|nr:uncharacterized protein LOC8055647 [Sorghum bicolor]KAG0550230.1 hypothetical protein BDA96_01G321800 [Sorghum bicolor]OQU92135.1 hypothetical protein SORBI_3001G297700 [Sorghum bicolor]|eukprot:XP_002467491.1 uncharacterized protein LOC8055647 [Sorghum bicolor]
MVFLVGEVLEANRTARRAYLRVLFESTGRDVAKKVICLLLWLEMTMGFQVLGSVATMTSGDMSLARVIVEACAVYNYVLHGSYEQPAPLVDIPTIVALCGVRGGRLVDSRFFMFHKDIVARGVAFIRDTFAPLIFDDYLHGMLHRFNDVSNSFLVPAPLPAPELMAPFIVFTSLPPEDYQTAFVAIPEHDPLSSQDIQEYFERRLMFGPCIERIDTERPGVGQGPKHCVIVFRSTQQRDEAMFQEAAAFFRVNNGDMWVQIYMPPL